ncbi:MAG: SpoIID/LytB domain-containing protein [Bacilli bacterium]|nr:SpoIID/LytB domain-containing protein [Bacilli bacterium]
MADEKFRVNDVGVDLDGLAADLNNQKADFYSETVFDFPEEPSRKSKTLIDDSDLSPSFSEKKSSSRKEYSEEDINYSNYEESSNFEEEHSRNFESMPINQDNNNFGPAPIEKDNNMGTIKEEQPKELPNDLNNNKFTDNKPETLDKPGLANQTNPPLDDKLDKAKDAKDKIPNGDMPNIPNTGNQNNPLDQFLSDKDNNNQQPPEEEPPFEEKPEEEKSLSERKKDRKKRNDANNADNLRNAADVAIATKDPTATAIGTTVKKADELTDGKSTELLGKALTNNFKYTPGGKQIQQSLNYINESGMGDKLGQAAALMNAGNGETGGNTPGGNTPPKGPQTDKKPEVKKEQPEEKKTEKQKEQSSKKSNKDSGSSKSDRPRINKGLLDNDQGDFLQYLIDHPYIIITIIIFLTTLLFILFKGDGKENKTCTYELNGVTSIDKIKVKDMKVELINCSGTSTNYTVLETVDFEKYVLGVALAEVGEDASDEELKAQIIIARNMALTRNKEICPNNQDNCFFGYNKTSGRIRLRACELDKVYWDYEKDTYVEYNDEINLYSPEITSGTIWKKALDETKKERIESIANTVKGLVLLDEHGNVIPISNNSVVFSDEDADKPYTEILQEYFGSSKYNKAVCK